jgi:hypothetical protein
MKSIPISRNAGRLPVQVMALVAILAALLTAYGCGKRTETETTIIKREVEVPAPVEQNSGHLERAGEKIDAKVNRKIDEAIDEAIGE